MTGTARLYDTTLAPTAQSLYYAGAGAAYDRPAGAPAGRPLPGHTTAFVADGHLAALTPAEHKIYTALTAAADPETWECRLTQAAIAAGAGFVDRAWAWRCLHALAAKGLIVSRRGQRGCTYTILPLPARARPHTEMPAELRAAITVLATDLRAELGDLAPLKSTATRLCNLYLRAGQPADAYLEACYQARAETRLWWGQIRAATPATGAGYARKRAIPYYCAILERLLGLREPTPDPAPTPAPSPPRQTF